MAAEAKKLFDEDVRLHGVEPARPRAALAAEGVEGPVSPARALQDQLAEEWDGREEKFPARYVTATVAVFCLATWFAVYQAYAAF